MKKLFTSLLLAACSLFAVSASAQTIPTSFKDSAGNVFTLDGLRSFECVTGGYKLQHAAEGFQLFYADTSGVCAKVQGSAYYQTYFVVTSGSSLGRNSLEARRVYNDSGNSKIIWKSGPEETQPGTVVLTAFQGRAQ